MVVILADNDKAGRDHAERVATVTHGLDVDDPIAVKVLVLPALPLGGDVFDWLAAGHDGQELALLVAGTPQWSPSS